MSDRLHPDLEPIDTSPRAKGATKIAWLAAGWLLFGVGVVGVVVPGLPTTGPMLLALWCFARGSERLHRWLLHHPTFGPPLRRWKNYRTLSLRSKVTAIVMMAASLAYVVWLSPLPRWWDFSIGALIVVGMGVVLRLPHRTGDDQG